MDTLRERRWIGRKEYEMADHLGNVVVTFLDRKTGYGNSSGSYIGFNADVASITDYYPGGFPIAERTFTPHYRFGSQKQEKDNEIYGEGNSYAFKYRMNDVRTNRMWSVDPLTNDYPELTPYQFASNRLIDNIELEGKEGEDYRFRFQQMAKGNAQAELAVTENMGKAFEATLDYLLAPINDLKRVFTGTDLKGNEDPISGTEFLMSAVSVGTTSAAVKTAEKVGRKNVTKVYPTRKKALDARPKPSPQKSGQGQVTRQMMNKKGEGKKFKTDNRSQTPHVHDKNHSNKKKANVHYRVGSKQIKPNN